MEGLQEEQVDYNSEPVYYCSKCLSLKIKRIVGIDDLDYCEDCGCTLIEQSSIEEWLKLYKAKYGFDYLNNKI